MEFFQNLLGPAWTPVWTVKIMLIVAPLMLAVAYVIYAERKVIGWMQVRIGPNHVGPGGWLQPIADAVKLIFKEIVIPSGANKARCARSGARRRNRSRPLLRRPLDARAAAATASQRKHAMTTVAPIPMPLAAGADARLHPPIARLFATHGYAEVRADNFDAFSGRAGHTAAVVHRRPDPVHGDARSIITPDGSPDFLWEVRQEVEQY